jgi:hypothetical protein
LHAVDIANLEPDDLAGSEPAAIAERQHHLDLDFIRHDHEPLGLARAHDQRQLDRLLQVIDLRRQIMPAQRHLEQELHTRHDPVAIADADAALGQMQLETSDVVGRRRLGRALQERGEPRAAMEMAALAMPAPLARVHILDHALA